MEKPWSPCSTGLHYTCLPASPGSSRSLAYNTFYTHDNDSPCKVLHIKGPCLATP